MLARTVALALVVSVTAIGLAQEMPKLPELPELQLTGAESAALVPLVREWNRHRRVPSSPIVVMIESLPYPPEIAPSLRISLLRHGVPDSEASDLLASARKANPRMWSLQSSSLASATRIRSIAALYRGMDPKRPAPTLMNLGDMRALAVPALSSRGQSAIVFWSNGLQMLNTPYHNTALAYLAGGPDRWRLEWVATFGEITFTPDPDSAPHHASLTPEDAAVIDALLDSKGSGPFELLDETLTFAESRSPHSPELVRNLLKRAAVSVFLPKPSLRHVVTMTDKWRGGSFVAVTLPAYSTDGSSALIAYHTLLPHLAGGGEAELEKRLGKWVVTSDSGAAPMAGLSANGPVRVGGDVKAPVLLKRIEPGYPPGAKRGTIIAELTIGADGKVEKATVLTSMDEVTRSAVTAALAQWRFEPATQNGKPLAVSYNVMVPGPK